MRPRIRCPGLPRDRSLPPAAKARAMTQSDTLLATLAIAFAGRSGLLLLAGLSERTEAMTALGEAIYRSNRTERLARLICNLESDAPAQNAREERPGLDALLRAGPASVAAPVLRRLVV